MSIMETIKEHPVAIGGGLLLVFLVVSRMGSGPSNGSSAAIAASLESQRIASGTNVSLSSFSADMVKSNNVALSEMWVAGIAAQADLARANTTAETQIYMQWLTSMDNQARIEAARAVGMSEIDAGKIVAMDNTAAQITYQRDQIQGNQKALETLGALDYAKDNQLLSFQAATLPTLLQHEVNLNAMNAGATIQLHQINADTATTLADTAARTSLSLVDLGTARQIELARVQNEPAMQELYNQRRVNNINSWVKVSESINSGVLKWVGGGMLSSDIRLKKNIVFSGQFTARGFALYDYEYLGSDVRFRGVMAHEVQAVNPGAVIEHAGFLMVDYSKV